MSRMRGLDDALPKPKFWFGDKVHTTDAALWIGTVDQIAHTENGWLYYIKVAEDNWTAPLQLVVTRYEKNVQPYVVSQ